MSTDPYETEWSRWAARFETMDREQLMHEARKWCFSTLMARDERRRIMTGTDHLLTSQQRRLARLWLLADHTKKSIPMDAFLKAFGVGGGTGPDGDQETDVFGPPRRSTS